MLLPSVLRALGEQLVSKMLVLDDSLQPKLAALSETDLAVSVVGWPFELQLQAHAQGLFIKPIDRPAASISIEPSAILDLNDPAHLTALIKADQLELSGDLAVLQRWSGLFQAWDPDWEALLADHIGSVPAYWLIKVLREAAAHQRVYWQQQLSQQVEYWVEQRPVVADVKGVRGWQMAVSQLSMETDALSQRIQRLSRDRGIS